MSNRDRIREALEHGPKTSSYFSNVMGVLDYFRRISELRKIGHPIKCERIEEGRFLYTLNGETK